MHELQEWCKPNPSHKGGGKNGTPSKRKVASLVSKPVKAELAKAAEKERVLLTAKCT